jgi:vanillate O-demethylase ferredoxin subunit
MTSDLMELRIVSRRAEALDIVSIELRDTEERLLPAFAPGAHLEFLLDVGTGTPIVRSYSICSDPADRQRYVVAVSRNDAGNGGSIAMHELLGKGTKVLVRCPRNNFELVPDATRYRFIAGGIGITPILSMVHWCVRKGKAWTLLYCARGAHRAAFYEQLSSHGCAVRFHFSEADGHADFMSAMSAPQPGEHVYCCGPDGLMHAVKTAGSHWPGNALHFEWFSAPATGSETGERQFEVVLRHSGRRLIVPAGKSILDVLETNGVDVPFSCREGLCRTCEVSICSGEAQHFDYVLSDEERRSQRSLMVCVSRAATSELELDL